MKLSEQITDRMESIAEAEEEAGFKAYAKQAFAKAEKILGEEITNKEAILPLAKQAHQKGILPDRLGEILAQG